jgi:hypothetical protein
LVAKDQGYDAAIIRGVGLIRFIAIAIALRSTQSACENWRRSGSAMAFTNIQKNNCVNVLYYVGKKILNHNGKVYKKGSVNNWVILRHYNPTQGGGLSLNYLGFYMGTKPNPPLPKGVIVTSWHKLVVAPRITSGLGLSAVQPKIPTPPNNATKYVKSGDCFGVSFLTPDNVAGKGVIGTKYDSRNGRFLYAVQYNNKVVWYLPEGKVGNNIKSIVYMHWNTSTGKTAPSFATNKNVNSYWIPQMVTRKEGTVDTIALSQVKKIPDAQ